jgi:hypothetical protein
MKNTASDISVTVVPRGLFPKKGRKVLGYSQFLYYTEKPLYCQAFRVEKRTPQVQKKPQKIRDFPTAFL